MHAMKICVHSVSLDQVLNVILLYFCAYTILDLHLPGFTTEFLSATIFKVSVYLTIIKLVSKYLLYNSL